ncbi:MAG TPA: SH3 domain-containing protein [Halomicronema sp.]
MKTLSGILQFILGIALAFALIGAGGVAAALYLAAKHSAQPERPFFDEEKIATTTNTKNSKTPPKQGTTAKQTSTAKPQDSGLYKARVTWPEGLSLRERPGFESKSIGGIEYNGRLIILEETADKEWQRVRIENTEREGWIKSGNVEKLASASDLDTSNATP